jgi:hypothetical protein
LFQFIQCPWPSRVDPILKVAPQEKITNGQIRWSLGPGNVTESWDDTDTEQFSHSCHWLPCSVRCRTVLLKPGHYALQKFPFFCVTLYNPNLEDSDGTCYWVFQNCPLFFFLQFVSLWVYFSLSTYSPRFCHSHIISSCVYFLLPLSRTPKGAQHLYVIPLHVEYPVAQRTFLNVALHRNSITACTFCRFRCTDP